MSSPPEKIPIETWSRGSPLRSAPIDFAAPAVASEIKSLRDKATPWHVHLLQGIQAVNKWASKPPSERPPAIELPDDFEASAQISRRLDDLVRQTRSQLISWLYQGRLLGYGFYLPRHAADQPRLIPQDIWLTPISWDRPDVAGNGLTFVAVHILHPATIAQEDSALPAPPPRIGRPSIRARAVSEFERALEDGAIDLNGSLANAARQVISRTMKNDPDAQGFGEKAVSNAIRDAFRKARAGTKE